MYSVDMTTHTIAKRRQRTDNLPAVEPVDRSTWEVSAEGIRKNPRIKYTRIAVFKRTPGPYGRIHLAGDTHPNALTYVLETGYANCAGALVLYQHGEMQWQDILRTPEQVKDVCDHPEIKRMIALHYAGARLARSRRIPCPVYVVPAWESDVKDFYGCRMDPVGAESSPAHAPAQADNLPGYRLFFAVVRSDGDGGCWIDLSTGAPGFNDALDAARERDAQIPVIAQGMPVLGVAFVKSEACQYWPVTRQAYKRG